MNGNGQGPALNDDGQSLALNRYAEGLKGGLNSGIGSREHHAEDSNESPNDDAIHGNHGKDIADKLAGDKRRYPTVGDKDEDGYLIEGDGDKDCYLIKENKDKDQIRVAREEEEAAAYF